MGSLIAPDHFTHILRVLNTNVDGRNKIMYAMTNIRGIGRRFSNFACKKGEVDMKKRAGECSAEDIENLMLITSNPRAYKTPDWFLNRQKDYKDGSSSQVTASTLDNKWREDFERMKKARVHRGLRHYWGLKVKGQHTKTTSRRGARMAMLAKQQARK